jgi:hypothetical protein
VLVSLEEFFDGNHDTASIGCNLGHHPGLVFFFETLKSLREQPSVRDVLVMVREVEEDFEAMWPFSDTVVVLAQASVQDVQAWAAPLQPDAVQGESADDLAMEAINVPLPEDITRACRYSRFGGIEGALKYLRGAC